MSHINANALLLVVQVTYFEQKLAVNALYCSQKYNLKKNTYKNLL